MGSSGGPKAAPGHPRVLSIAVTVSGIVAVLFAHASLNASRGRSHLGLANPQTQRADEVLLLVTIMLIALAAVNAVFITRADGAGSPSIPRL